MPFPQVMGAGLFNIDVLARLASPDAHQCVPVVRRGDGDSINGLVVEQLTQVLVAFGSGMAHLFNLRLTLANQRFIRVAQSSDLDVLKAGQLMDVILPAPVQSDHRNAHPVVGPQDARRYDFSKPIQGCQSRSCRSDPGLEEVAPADFRLSWFL